MHERVVVIVGAGFCGAVLAARLVAEGRGRLRVLLVNKSGRMARGLAYGTRSEQHVLNVPAGRMSAFDDDEDDFLRFARRQDPAIGPASFVSRQLYGEYLAHVLERAETSAAPGVSLERVASTVTDVALTPDRARALVAIDGLGRVLADHVVLALGNYAPAHPRLADRRFVASERYVRDPWAPGALDAVPRGGAALLLGTGLTTLDIALELRSRGRSPLIAISRRGLLPEAHRATDRPHATVPPPPGILDGPPTVLAYLRAVRGHVRRLAAEGVDWRDVLVALRPITPALWRRLDHDERARFLRHVRPYWDVHRHRAAPRPAAILAGMIRDEELVVLAARLEALTPVAGGIEAVIRRRGQARAEPVRVAAVVNCTGPCTDVRALDEPLVNALRWHRLLRPDAHGLGVDVAPDGALLDAAGRPSRVLSAVGPLRRGAEWEATAVPELRGHVHRLVARLTAAWRPS